MSSMHDPDPEPKRRHSQPRRVISFRAPAGAAAHIQRPMKRIALDADEDAQDTYTRALLAFIADELPDRPAPFPSPQPEAARANVQP